jgi:hypothetical protein
MDSFFDLINETDFTKQLVVETIIQEIEVIRQIEVIGEIEATEVILVIQ